MKTQNRLVTFTLTLIAAGLILQARAQYRAIGEDGIAASPKVRQMIKFRALAPAQPQAAPSLAPARYRANRDDGIVASPKVRAMRDEQLRNRAMAAPSAPVSSVGYRPTGDDGITASPKLRQQLREHRRPAVETLAAE